MRKIVMTFLLMQVASICLGAPVYEWKDDRGVLHFTDDIKNVPQRYQKRVQERDLGAEEKGKDVTPPVQIIPPTPTPPIQPPPSMLGGPDTVGGHSSDWWRNRFASLRTQMEALQGGLAAKEQRLNEVRRRHLIFQRPSDRVAGNDLAADVDRDQAKIKELQAELATLQQDADRAGVPREWR